MTFPGSLYRWNFIAGTHPAPSEGESTILRAQQLPLDRRQVNFLFAPYFSISISESGNNLCTQVNRSCSFSSGIPWAGHRSKDSALRGLFQGGEAGACSLYFHGAGPRLGAPTYFGLLIIMSKRSASSVPSAADRARSRRRMDSPISGSGSSSDPREESDCDLLALAPISFVSTDLPQPGAGACDQHGEAGAGASIEPGAGASRRAALAPVPAGERRPAPVPARAKPSPGARAGERRPAPVPAGERRRRPRLGVAAPAGVRATM
ncbi:hypothetical protein Bca52824_011021 [Brassica carinata]|uniref:Uncharacterized protein n=1 Tax=Brassica carinata TaxID=52824 RepID=A0A8X7WCH3_BRACI|nr:hypothetical protein Bca52824_011021 [Brassica carinata]